MKLISYTESDAGSKRDKLHQNVSLDKGAVLCTGVLWGGIGDGASSHISFIMEKLRIMNIRQPPPQGIVVQSMIIMI